MLIEHHSGSGFFRDMLQHSSPSSSSAKPIELEEEHEDVEILLIIISGHPCESDQGPKCEDWETAKRLYLLMQKYQLDRLRPWFTLLASDHLLEAPFEALCIACNNPCFDEELARFAILFGIEDLSATALYSPEYFEDDFDKYEKDDEKDGPQKAHLLGPKNVKAKLSVELGSKGWFGYCKAFSNLEEHPYWEYVAIEFIKGVREFENAKGIEVSRRVPVHMHLWVRKVADISAISIHPLVLSLKGTSTSTHKIEDQVWI